MTEVIGITPLPGVEYPLSVQYCGNCTMPVEYCEYYPAYDKCKQWLEKNLPDMFQELMAGASAAGEDGADEEKKRQKRGGKGIVKAKKKADEGPRKVVVFVAPRGKKRNTVITGLKTFNIDLKVAAKFFGTKFACGSSVTGDDEIVVQGDIKDDLLDMIPEKWPEIDEECVEDGGEHKR
ncbi:density-regulated protein homolog [Penaeus monodon]|uniref:density-regulated protein homolog n=1 Tax=Penaeus monodon TaxID=6687 RepID=UPI0018A6E027|nr:density-regulated protein homolog [Penaeus monodon]